MTKYIKGNVVLSNIQLIKLPDFLSDVDVKGYFICVENYLSDLVGSPKSVTATYDCSYNRLDSLKGAPTVIGGPTSPIGEFICRGNKLKDLKFAPTIVSRAFDCSYNDIKSLKGAPSILRYSFDCRNNQLASLEGGPTDVGISYLCAENLSFISVVVCPI